MPVVKGLCLAFLLSTLGLYVWDVSVVSYHSSSSTPGSSSLSTILEGFDTWLYCSPPPLFSYVDILFVLLAGKFLLLGHLFRPG